jgi:hypothetical protein
MKLKLDMPTAGDVKLIVPGVGEVRNGDTFEVSEELGTLLVDSPQFIAVKATPAPSKAEKGSEK